jgi:ATP-dependent Clp protease adapter protein ClpS
MDIDSAPIKEKTTTQKPKVTRPWQVILYNDDIHSVDEVILQVQKATGCALHEATRITLEAHFKGKAVAFKGEFSECHRVAGVLREIGLLVEIQG